MDTVTFLANFPLVLVICYFYWRMLDARYSYWKSLALYGLYYAAELCVNAVLVGPQDAFPGWITTVYVVACVVCTVTVWKLLSKSSLTKVILFHALLIVVLAICSSASHVLARLICESPLPFTAEQEGRLWMFIACALQFVSVFILTEAMGRYFKNHPIDIQWSAFAGVICAQALMLMIIGYLTYSNASGITIGLCALLVAVCLLSDIRLQRALKGMVKSAELEEEIHVLERQQAVRHAHYQHDAEQLDEMRRLRHDLHNTLTTIKLLIEEGACQSAAELAAQTDEAYEQVRSNYSAITGDPVVDAVLHGKSGEAEKLGIQFHCALALPAHSGLSEREWMSILANLIDNAIEYCSGLDEAEARAIEVFSRTQGRLLKIGVSNTFLGNAVPDVTTPVSTKCDGERHGYGLKIVNRIAQAHGGCVNAELKDHVLTISVLVNTSPMEEAQT